jgi:hypothetical protein
MRPSTLLRRSRGAPCAPRASPAKAISYRLNGWRAKTLEAVEQTDDLNRQARVLADLADVVGRAGRGAEVTALQERAVALYERRGSLVFAERLRAGLEGRAGSPQ